MKLAIGDRVRYNGKGVLMTISRIMSNDKALCVWFKDDGCRRYTFDCSDLVKEEPLSTFTVEVCVPSCCIWKRCKIRTYVTTAHTSHEARRKILQMLLKKNKRVLSTQIVDRYPEGA